MVNAMIGGTVMSDGAGQGSRLDDAMPRHLTTLALRVGMSVAIFSMIKEGSTVNLIVIAQACTVIGLPALAAALIYLGTRRELSGQRKTPRLIPILASLVFWSLVSWRFERRSRFTKRYTARTRPGITYRFMAGGGGDWTASGCIDV